jgi:hypothetical protein
MSDEVELRRLAIRRADMKLGFRAHIMAYAIVNAGLTAINLVTTPDHLWFYWPMIGWVWASRRTQWSSSRTARTSARG